MGDWSKEAMSGLKWTAYMWPILSGLSLGLENKFLLSSLAWADASKAVGIESTYPLFVLIWSYFFLDERIAPLAYLGIFLALAGSIVLSFDVLKSIYAYVTAKYSRFKKYHEHFVLIEKEKHESMAKDAAKKSSNKYYGRCWYPFIKTIDECRMKNYSGNLHDLIESGSANTLYYSPDRLIASRDQYEDSDSDEEIGEGEEGGGESGMSERRTGKRKRVHDPYMAPDLVYKEDEDDEDDDEYEKFTYLNQKRSLFSEEEMQGMEYYDVNNEYSEEAVSMRDINDESNSENDARDYHNGMDSEGSEEMGNFASTKSLEIDMKRTRRRRRRRKDENEGKKKKIWILELINRNKRVITGLLPIPVFMSGNDFFAKLSVDGFSEDEKTMPTNNVSAINSISLGLVLLCTLFTPKARKHFVDEFKYNVLFSILIEGFNIFANYLIFIAMDGLSASLVSSLSSTRPFFILIFEKLCGLSKDSVQQIIGFKLPPILVTITGAIIIALAA